MLLIMVPLRPSAVDILTAGTDESIQLTFGRDSDFGDVGLCREGCGSKDASFCDDRGFTVVEVRVIACEGNARA